MTSLLLEIGTEEIPAGYIQPALDSLARNLAASLADGRIGHGALKTYGTPRRLAVFAENVADRQEPITQKVMGPPEKVAFNDQGQPSIAAEKFAQKVGVSLSGLSVAQTDKGRYLCATVKDKGLDTKAFLKQVLPEIILAVPFPKTMRWSDMSISFCRPIQTIVALLGKSIISFSLDNRLKSGRNTWGHLFMNHQRIKIDDADEYTEKMQNAQVIVDIDQRKQMVRKQIAQAASALNGQILSDESLVDINTNLVEIPFASGGRFEDDFLKLPPEILITAMREHQKYFAVVDTNKKLMPCFVAVNNTLAKDMDLVAKGHERVLRARLSDARFFYQADRQEKMDGWKDKLKGVLFQAKLGSMYDKTQRVETMAAYLADIVAPDIKSHVVRAAQLCKADLVSQAVGEFANLQGVMGRVYAQVAGEASEVASAIEEHYRPVASGSALPETQAGALLAIADKLDTICGCFSVDLIPTGASDPYALRRQSIGIVQIMLSHKFSFSLKDAIHKAVSGFNQADTRQTEDAVCHFIKQRIDNILADEGFAKDVIFAVTSVSVDNIPYVWQRVDALHQMKGQPDFEPLAVAFKRVVNILKKEGIDGDTALAPDTSLFQDPSEESLYESVRAVQQQVKQCLMSGRFGDSLKAISTLRSPVDGFFDNVMVMVEDSSIRDNRLALLNTISSLFNEIADFSKIET
ncbi:MAG: glycine--tRNA ligase subunit beta [Desulfobacteraceae bacterium]|nr:glycine--tRNA ligase subunit beta [Desulfobacteraceae bacterium]